MRGSLFAFVFALLSGAIAPAALVADDCNQNGIPDEDDLAPAFALSAASSFVAGTSSDSKPCAALAADLDGDGLPDLVVVNGGSNSVSLFTHRGPKQLLRRVEISLGEGPCALASADLDQDGDIDLVVAGGIFPSPGWLRVLKNNGGGELASSADLFTLSSPTSLVAADLDGDGRIDLAVADRSRDGVMVGWNLGELAFEEGPFLPTGRGPVAMAAVDLDGDGLADVATANELSGTVSFLWNRGSRAFDAAASVRVGSVPSHVVHGDFNRDGLEDLAIAHRGSKDARVLLNEGARAFRAGQVISFDNAPAGFATADVDADGNADLLVLQNAVGAGHPIDTTFDPRSSVLVLYAKGTGSFGGKRELVVGPPAVSLLASDLDADGHADLVSAHASTGTVSVLWGAKDDAFAAAVVSPIFTESRFAAGDFNHDGRIDIALKGDAFLSASVLWNAGGGDFSRHSKLPYSWTSAVAAGDLDGDGDADLVIADRSAPWEDKYAATQLLWSSGDGSFEVGEAIDGAASEVLAVDVDGDGDLDLALPTGSDLRVLWNQGGRRFEAGVAFTLDEEARHVVFGDIDGDGRPDFAAVGTPDLEAKRLEDGTVVVSIAKPGAIVLYLRGPNGEYRSVSRLPGTLDLIEAVLDDLDGDGALDLAALDQGSNELLVWLNRGAAGFQAAGKYAAGMGRVRVPILLQSPRSIATGDLDGDGDMDIAVSSPGTSSVLAFINRGDGTFGEAQGFAVDGAPGHLMILDLDGTGRMDLLVHCENSQDLWAIRNTSSPPRSTDCNRNGKPDECDIASGSSLDADSNGLPDECGARFRRGDSNTDGKADLSDAVHVLGYLFLGLPQALECPASADTNGDGTLGLSDAVALLDYLFLSGPEPAAPFKTCGFARISGGLECEGQKACE